MKITYEPIGEIHSPFENIEGMPIQPSGADDAQGEILIFPAHTGGLEGLDDFSHLILLYHFHRVTRVDLKVLPFLDAEPHGVFSTRAPTRPNPLGLSVVELESRNKNILRIKGVDILHGTPLLDIKPYVPEFDHFSGERIGWYSKSRGQSTTKKSDDRFR
ncbi:MAG: tRNA (N6-threonylcarbamoyladenosine(37)-N6)-methyltransferase TrmO [Planctomycetes bacterium]|nr:tRNA (N6-threonylcarbamoyladenosine(37)-N6)-methyltransferase TrmO [Planctomycetota bacterium]